MKIDMAVKINDELFDIISTNMKILLIIGLLKQCSMFELREASQVSWVTVYRVIPKLYQKGLIEINDGKSPVGGRKKIIKLTKKGEAIFKKLLELNEFLNSLNE